MSDDPVLDRLHVTVARLVGEHLMALAQEPEQWPEAAA